MLFFAGPAHVGQSFTYHITGTLSTQAAPNVSTLVLTWTAPTRLYARLSGSGDTAAVSITRADNGMLSVPTSGANDAGAAAVATLLNQLNFPGLLAARLNGSDHAQTTLSITPLAPQKSLDPVSVAVNLDLVNSSENATLIADGNSTKRNASPGSGYGGRRGGGMGGGWMGRGGGWQSQGSDQNPDEQTAQEPPVGFALEAAFDQSGSLQHATYREIFASTTKGAAPIEETFIIDRIENARQPN
jgi:hypothetical protein